ncbi:MAG: nodulation protein NfeD [Pirellulaceae bacterium]|mgnify:CR=1 FL=1|nr:nodulation protein NfeD [Pirellulaceae bacterium]
MEYYWIWASVLVALGAGLAMLEVFFPSAGILGFLAASSLITAVVLAFMQNSVLGVVLLVVELVGIPILIAVGLKLWPNTRMGKRVLLTPPDSKDVLPTDPEKERLRELIGQQGRAKSKMLLSGLIEVDGEKVDAVSESAPIEVNQPVLVVRVQGNRVVVRPVDEEPATPPADPLDQTFDDPFEVPPA